MQELTVSSLLRYLKTKIDNDDNLHGVYVVGEISNYTRQSSGHLYFTLKDEYAAIRCVMFRSAASSLNFEPKTGDKVIVYANTSIYETRGDLQLFVLKMNLDGSGDLYAKYEALKKKLSEEGKFSENHKKPLEKYYLDRVAVLVGDNSAAMSDIKICFKRRWPLCKADYYPVLVQGNDAPADIISRLKQVDNLGYDAIILARGGGSFEDLFCFNDENLVNCIYDLNTFIVTGVGHEQDFTLVDFVSDLRAATPTAAVELITPDINDVYEMLYDYEYSLNDSLNNLLSRKQMDFDFIYRRLLNYRNTFTNISSQIDNTINMLNRNIRYRISTYNDYIANDTNRMNVSLNHRLNEKQLVFKRLNTLLEAYSAENVLKRGYTLVYQDGKLIKTKEKLKDDTFEVKFIDGTIEAIKR